jgi:hypothetical protein
MQKKILLYIILLSIILKSSFCLTIPRPDFNLGNEDNISGNYSDIDTEILNNITNESGTQNNYSSPDWVYPSEDPKIHNSLIEIKNSLNLVSNSQSEMNQRMNEFEDDILDLEKNLKSNDSGDSNVSHLVLFISLFSLILNIIILVYIVTSSKTDNLRLISKDEQAKQIKDYYEYWISKGYDADAIILQLVQHGYSRQQIRESLK